MSADPFPIHIRGHQDDFHQVEDLPHFSRMNFYMYSLSKSILDESFANEDPSPFPSFSFSLHSISCCGIRIESCLAKSVVDVLSTLTARKYWILFLRS